MDRTTDRMDVANRITDMKFWLDALYPAVMKNNLDKLPPFADAGAIEEDLRYLTFRVKLWVDALERAENAGNEQ